MRRVCAPRDRRPPVRLISIARATEVIGIFASRPAEVADRHLDRVSIGEASLDFDASRVKPDQLIQALDAIGFKARAAS